MRIRRLNEKDRKELVADLCYALLNVTDPKEMAEVLMDLLYPVEIEAIAKRLKVAELLTKGLDYEGIRESLRVGYATIARVKTWLSLSGKGFSLLLRRKVKRVNMGKNEEERFDPQGWYNFKRRYSAYFWPQLVLEEFLENSNKAEKRKFNQILDKMKDKAAEFNSKRNRELYQHFSKK